jgi:hypothetical protein
LQTYPNIEIVLVNAKGQGHRAVGDWCGRFPLRMTTNLEPLHRSQAANAGLDAAQGKYLTFLDDDDLFLPTHIAGLKTELEKNESLAAVYSAVKCINQSGTEIRQFNESFDPILFRTENFIPIHAVLFRRSNVENGVRFDETLTLCEDWDFWLQMLEYGQFRLFPETTAIYRMELSQSGVWENAALSQQMMTIIYRKWFLRWPDNILWRIMEYARCKNIINQRDRQIHAMNLTIHERDKTIQQQIEILQQNSESIRERDTLITTRNQQITDILASTSWKVTKPLRALKQFAEKIMR